MNQTKSSKSKEIVAGNSMKGKTFSAMYFEIAFEMYPFFRFRYAGDMRTVRGSRTLNPLYFAPRSLKVVECE